MEAQHNLQTNGVVRSKPRKKKPVLQGLENFQSPMESLSVAHELRSTSLKKGQKSSKRGPTEYVSPVFQREKSISDSVPDSSTIGNEYRALRHKYLLLEEKSFAIGKELKEIEDDAKALEEEKLSLLDELVVLEGLIDPSELQLQGQRLQ